MVTCVRVPTTDGEAVRQAVAAAGLLDTEYELVTRDGNLYIPVTEEPNIDGLPSTSVTIVDADVPTADPPKTPTEILGWSPTYEIIGSLALLDEADDSRAQDAADAIMASSLGVDGVLNSQSNVKGETRVRDWAVLAGDTTVTTHTEYGFDYMLDVTEVYFSPRLATERHRVAEQVNADEHVFDMFAGVGPYAVPAAAAGAVVTAVDVNEDAIKWLRKNAAANNVADAIDAYATDVRTLAASYRGTADRLVMNLPHSANEFLDTAFALASDDAVIHYYDFCPEETMREDTLRPVREAAEEYGYDVTPTRVEAIRPYAPDIVNVAADIHIQRTR